MRLVKAFCVLAAMSCIDSAFAQCPPALVWDGNFAADNFGIDVDFAGDIDKDGFDDFVIGAHRAAADSGRAYIMSGFDGSLIFTLKGATSSTFFGQSVAGAGDVNNDGFPDVIVGAPLDNLVGAQSGRAFVFSGQTGSIIWTFTPTSSGGKLGWSVDGAGDVDGDNFDDLIVGAPSAEMAMIYSGQTGLLLDSVIDTGPGAAGLGFSVAGGGDIDKDGFDDVIVGIPNAGSNLGRILVYSPNQKINIIDKTGLAANEQFGASVSGSADVNGDLVRDIIVGAPNHDSLGAATGRAYVLSGVDGSLIYSFSGRKTFDSFGLSVAGSGDMNNDGFPEIIVGSRGDDAGGLGAGRVIIFSGQTGDTLFNIVGPSNPGIFSHAVAGGGDFNADGIPDVVVGAPLNDVPGVDAGRAYAYSIPTNACFNSIWEASSVLLPDEVCPPWNIGNNADTEIPQLQGDTLVLATSVNAENMRYIQIASVGVPLSIPDTWVIEFAVRYVSGASADASFSHISVQLIADVGDLGQGNFFHIGQDEIYLWSSFATKGPTATVDTDDSFHTYRIEVNLLTDIKVYYDDSLTLVGTIFPSAGFGSTELLTFGDVTGVSFGESRWLSFKHNAFTDTDTDGDGFDDCLDNCPNNFNPLQEDFDGDGLGDSCFVPPDVGPLVCVLHEFVPPSPPGAAGQMPIDPELNIRVTDPEGLVIGADSLDVISNTIGAGVSYNQIGGNDSVVIDLPKTGIYIFEIIREAGSSAPGFYTIGIRTDGTVELVKGPFDKPFSGETDTVTFISTPYIPGDANTDRKVNISDVTYLIARIFAGGPPPIPLLAGDANCTGTVNIADVTYLIARIFAGGPAPGCN